MGGRAAALAALALCVTARADAVAYDLAGGQVTVDPSSGLSGVTVTVGGVSFQPFQGGGAIGADGRRDPAIRLALEPAQEGDALRLRITCDDPRARGIHPGHVRGLGEWRRLDLSRQATPHGQTWWPKTVYSVEGDFWFTAHWVMEHSNATSWNAEDQQNEGSGPFCAALSPRYEPDTAGAYLPVREVLELRVSRDLWTVVPLPRQAPSEYAAEMAGMVQVDLWGGRAAPELNNLLTLLKAAGRGRMRFLSVLQNWQVGGFDSLLPDSVWMPDYPPNARVGTVEELRALCALGNSMGRFGFRTNYRVLRRNSPSFLGGIAHFAVGPDGTERDYLSPGDWPAVAGRQEKEIAELFAPTASFTDQLTSGACPGSWHDFDAQRGSRSMRETLERMRALARLIKTAHGGPLGSESLIDQEMLGYYVDFGDWSIMNGHHRLCSPEFKLRRLHHLSMFHGMGLMYRFYESPPFPLFHSARTTFNDDPAQLDDYRCTEVLYGNGAYICYGFANWRYWLTECLLVGHLQQYYALQPVRQVRYERSGEWVRLEDLVRAGGVPATQPWLPQTEAFGRIRVEYANGLTVVANRLPEPLPVADALPEGITLPQYGWVAWAQDGSLVSFSANWPHTQQRVDYLRDDRLQVEYIDPRGATVRGVDRMTLWEKGVAVLTADPGANSICIDGQTMPLNLPAPEPLSALAFEFETSLDGWEPAEGILTSRIEDGSLLLHTVTADPQTYSPVLALDGDRSDSMPEV